MPVSYIAIFFMQPHPNMEINETNQKVSTFHGCHKYTPNVNNGNCTHKAVSHELMGMHDLSKENLHFILPG
jgi:hypothetical protein